MKSDLPNVGRVTDNGENDVGLRGEGFGRVGPVGPQGEKVLCFRGGSCEDGEFVTGFDQVGAHGETHNSGSDPSQASI